MNWLLVLYIGYPLMFLLVFRRVCGRVAHNQMTYSQKHPDGDDWIAGAVIGLICGALWPITLPVLLAIRLYEYAVKNWNVNGRAMLDWIFPP